MYLSEGDRLVEVLCGVIMVLVMIGYLRLSLMGEDHIELKRTMILIPLGCNAAWGIIDGIMYVLTDLIERGKIYRLSIKTKKDQEEIKSSIEDELSSTVVDVLEEEEKEKISDEILKRVNPSDIEKPEGITKKDLVVILFTFLTVFSTAIPLIIPFIIFDDIILAIRISFAIGIAILFSIGLFWGKYASRNKIRSALAIVTIGIIVVGITIALGG